MKLSRRTKGITEWSGEHSDVFHIRDEPCGGLQPLQRQAVQPASAAEYLHPR
jgi:hypothetical protein